MTQHPITTTLNRIRAHGPCEEGWTKLLRGLGKTKADDEPVAFATIHEINGIDDTLWCCRAEPQHSREWRLFAVWCARQVQRLMTKKAAIDALDVAERHATGNATDDELAAAWAAVNATARATANDTAGDTAWDAAWATALLAAGATAWDAVRATALLAAGATAWDAVRAITKATALDAAWDAAWDAARGAQAKKFLEIVNEHAAVE